MNRRRRVPVPDRDMPIRIVHVEDEPNDRELVAASLRLAGLTFEIDAVDTREAFIAALGRGVVDVILADDHLPAFDGRAAQAIAAELTPDVPFIFVSGTLGEDIAVERLKDGATDYVLKQRLSRLPASIKRAIIEARTRIEHRTAEAEIRRLNADLEARVARRTSQLASANAALGERQDALRLSEQRLQGILDHSPTIVYLKDLDGRFLLVNRQFEKTHKLDAAAVRGRTVHDVFPPRLAEIYAKNDEQASKVESTYVEEPVLIEGRAHVFSTAKFPLIGTDGRPYAMCAIATDVTERKKADDEVKAARLEAERANRAKSEFLSRMSHDLRTPLNAVLGFAQLLESETLSDSQRECVQQILHGGQHLLDLINEVLDIARIEAGRLSLSAEPVSVKETVRHALALVAPLASKRQITLEFQEEAATRAVIADRQRLNQILLNLLSNAVKYNRTGGRVIVSTEEVPNERLRIKVTDTGGGIPRAKMKLLFTPFERLGADATAIEGTGLGLALSRGLAEAMGGTIGVASEVDRGSTFWVELTATNEPAQVGEEAGVADASLGCPSPRVATILYIEDNGSNVRLMERILGRRPGVTLVHAAQGHIGVTLAGERRPDLIFLDMHLPDMSGEEVLRQLWEDPDLRRIPVVILSADATPGQVRRVMASGAAAYLTKPLDLGKVLNTLDQMLTSAPPGAADVPGGIVT